MNSGSFKKVCFYCTPCDSVLHKYYIDSILFYFKLPVHWLTQILLHFFSNLHVVQTQIKIVQIKNKPFLCINTYDFDSVPQTTMLGFIH